MKDLKYKQKLLLYRTLLILCANSIGFTLNDHINRKYRETFVKVSKDIRFELYEQNIIPIENYKHNKYLSTEENIDEHITTKTLKKLTTLHIDMNENNNLDFLEVCPKLKTIEIDNSQLLNDSDIKILNKSSVQEIILYFNLNSISKDRETKFDISRFKNKNIKIKQHTNEYDELNNLILLNYLKNYSPQILEEYPNIEEYINLNNKINDIIKELKLNDNMTDIEKLLLISNYICLNIKYDKDVAYYSYTNYLKNDTYKEIAYYNTYTISSIINKENVISEKEGICINYACLFDILCYKTNVKTRLVTGINEEKNSGHAWNIVYLDDIEKYIDLTQFDASIINEVNLYYYANNGNINFSKDYYYDELINSIFKDIENNYSNYKLTQPLKTLDKKEEKTNITYYNETIDGTAVNKQNLLIPLITNLGCIGIMATSEQKNKRKERIKNNN